MEKQVPEYIEKEKQNPIYAERNKNNPSDEHSEKEIPKFGNPENCITVNGETIEIKPTKLKYHRNRDTIGYHLLLMYPVSDVVCLEKGAVDKTRDGDKILYDWLIAVLDDPNFVKRNYNDMTTEDVERILKIYCRMNHIDEKEKTKNLVAKMETN